MHFVSRSQARAKFEGRAAVIVGSGPGVLANAAGFVDSHDVVVRVNNYRLSAAAGRRTDVFYSFFGGSIRKTAAELRRDGVTLCLCKCPDAHVIESDWHRRNDKIGGVDFRWIYQHRAQFWFCDTYVPSKEEFLVSFNLLGRHIPTTGFAAILDVLSFDPSSLYLTGFDFFRSGLHNVSDRWTRKNDGDPIGHMPERELAWLADNAKRYPISTDAALSHAMQTKSAA